MANNYWQFSKMIECDEKERDLLVKMIMAAEADESICQWEVEDGGVWLYAEEHFSEDGLSEVLCEWLKQCGKEDPIDITYCTWCSKPRLDEFSGGVMIFYPGYSIMRNSWETGQKIIRDESRRGFYCLMEKK